MILRFLVYFLMVLTLHGCGGRPVVSPTLPMGIPLQDVCNRYHVTWQWDGVTQVVLMEYRGNISKAIVGSSTVLLGQKQIILSAPLRRENSTIYVPEDFEAKVLAPFGVPISGLSPVESSSRVHVIVIDAGHGGKDLGTMSSSGGMNEKDIVLDVTKRLRMLLEDAGIKVIMTRDTDDFISLPERTIIAARSGADLFISVHVNSNRDHSVNGLLVYYLDAITRKDVNEEQRIENERTYLHSLSANDSPVLQGILTDMMNTMKTAQSQRLAKSIIRAAREEPGVRVRGDGMRLCRFFVVRNTLIPAVLVETGFLSNRLEHIKLISPLYRQKMAEVIAGVFWIMPMNNHCEDPIGVFDSGLGGLTVVKELIHHLPNERIVYFGDTARVPYGTKSAETIIRYSREIVRALLKHKVKMVVVACNTASSLALDVLKKEFDLPILGVIEPGARKAMEVTRNKKVGIIATSSTVKSGKYAQKIIQLNKNIAVFSQSCPLFVPLVEEGWFDHAVTYQVAQQYLADMKKNKVDTLILGCTHYPLLKTVLHNVMGSRVQLVDSAQEVALQVKQELTRNGLSRTRLSPGRHMFIVTDEPKQFQRLASRFLGGGVKNVRRHIYV